MPVQRPEAPSVIPEFLCWLSLVKAAWGATSSPSAEFSLSFQAAVSHLGVSQSSAWSLAYSRCSQWSRLLLPVLSNTVATGHM